MTMTEIQYNNEMLFRTMFEQAAVGVAQIISKTGRFVKINQRYCDILGYSREELERRTFQEITHPADLQSSLDNLRRLLSGDMRQFSIEKRYYRKNGTSVWVNLTVSPMWGPADEPSTHIAVVEDITARKQAEEALRRSNLRLELLAKTARLLLSSTSPQEVMNSLCRKVLVFLDCDAFFNYLVDEEKQRLHLNACGGIPEEDVQKMEWLDYGVGLCGRSARDGCRLVVENVQETHDQYTDLVKPFGIQAYACHPLISQGKVLGTLSFCTRNRTRFTDDELSLIEAVADLVSISLERIMAEEKLRKANDDLEKCVAERTEQLTIAVTSLEEEIAVREKTEESLRKNRELLGAVVEGTSDAIFVKDLLGRYRLLNTAASRFSGKSSDEVIGRDDTFLFPSDEARAVMEGDRTVMASGETITYEENLTSPDGEQRLFLSTKGPLFDERGNVAGIFGVARDITERKRLETERLEMERKLLVTQKMESLGVLAGGISHDYNNLLAAILGNLDLSLHELPTDSPVRGHLEQAMLASERAADLTRQMLAYSGRGLFVLKENDLNEVVYENSDLWRASVNKNVALNITTAPDIPLMETDRGQLQQVIMNLLVNASEAIGNTPGVITLGTGVQECDDEYLDGSRLEEKPVAGRYVYLEVSDTGCGMDEETLQRIFDPFFTTKFMGRGLGMSAVLGIVRAHRGAIVVASEKGQGSTFRVLFPASAEAAARPTGVAKQDRSGYGMSVARWLNTLEH